MVDTFFAFYCLILSVREPPAVDIGFPFVCILGRVVNLI